MLPPIRTLSGVDLSLEGEASLGGFLLYAEGTLGFSQQSLLKYSSTLRQVARQLGLTDLRDLATPDLLRLRAGFVRRRLSESWHASVVFSLRSYFRYVQAVEGREPGFEMALLEPPKRRRREVVYLTPDEVERLVGAVRLENLDGTTSIAGYRLRALIEVILGSGLRISEVLGLDIGQIDRASGEGKVVGKGGKERRAYLTERALGWLDQYLALRTDDCPALFVTLSGRQRMKRPDIWRFFAALRQAAGIEKPVTPHILRHTAATQMLFNGCPIGHIKQILGHERLETTCRYYLGTDQRAAKAAHREFLRY